MGRSEIYFFADESLDVYFVFVQCPLLLFCNRFFFCILTVPCSLVYSIYIYLYITFPSAKWSKWLGTRSKYYALF